MFKVHGQRPQPVNAHHADRKVGAGLQAAAGEHQREQGRGLMPREIGGVAEERASVAGKNQGTSCCD